VLCENYLGIFRAVGPPDAEPAFFFIYNQKSEEEKIVKQPEERCIELRARDAKKMK
jgi:hypothetical protein